MGVAEQHRMVPREYCSRDLRIVAHAHGDGYHNAADTDFIDRPALYWVELANVENGRNHSFHDSGRGGRFVGQRCTRRTVRILRIVCNLNVTIADAASAQILGRSLRWRNRQMLLPPSLS